jgi:putative membrane protein
VLLLALLAGAYALAVRSYGARPRETARFAGGLAVLAGSVLGPVAELAEHAALSVHMLQHLLLTLVVPPLWLAGLPAGWLDGLARAPGLGRLGRGLTRPPVALGVLAAAQIVWHLPVCFEAALRHEAIHALEHGSLLATALVAWWPVLGRAAGWPRPAPPAQLLYLFLCTLPMMAVAGPITLADRVLYPYYESVAAVWPLTPRADQELAGVVMWVGGTLGYLIAGTVVFFRWALAEEPAERGPALASGPD